MPKRARARAYVVVNAKCSARPRRSAPRPAHVWPSHLHSKDSTHGPQRPGIIRASRPPTLHA